MVAAEDAEAGLKAWAPRHVVLGRNHEIVGQLEQVSNHVELLFFERRAPSKAARRAEAAEHVLRPEEQALRTQHGHGGAVGAQEADATNWSRFPKWPSRAAPVSISQSRAGYER